MQRGDGADKILDLDATPGNSDRVDFLGDIASSQLWFARQGSDLQVSVIGTADKVTISNWYLDPIYQVESLTAAGDGRRLDASKVASMVSAMSAFTPPAQGQINLPSNYQSSLAGIMASSWA